MDVQPVLKEFKRRIQPLYGDKLSRLVLFGSWARSEQSEDSDIDVAVVLKGPLKAGREIDRMIDVVTDLNLEYGVLLSIYPVSDQDYMGRRSPLLINIRKEGIQA